MFHTLISIFIIIFIVCGIEGFGVSPGTLFARVNDTFKISCFVDHGNGELNFYDDDEIVSNGDVKRINDTFIELTKFYSRPVRKNFTCKQEDNNVGLSEVFIDKRMAAVDNFKCRSNDLLTLTCSYRKPPYNLPIKYQTQFSINHETPHQLKLKQNYQGGYSTKIKLNDINKSPNETFVTFIINAKNKFYHFNEKFDLKLLETFQPRAIEKIDIMTKLSIHNESSAHIKLLLPKEVEKISNEMLFDVQLKLADETDEKWIKIIDPRLQVEGRDGYLIIDNLNYANTVYNLKIRMKTKDAEDIDEMWSPYKEMSFKTPSKVPEETPITCRNCYNVMDNGNIVIYWMAVPKLYQNADNFRYLVRGRNENNEQVFDKFYSDTSMMLELEGLRANDLKIEIFSVNNKGTSESFSEILIPIQRSNQSGNFLKIRKELHDQTYRLSWKVMEEIDIESFNILWCYQRNELPNQCDGPINILEMAANTFELELNASSLIQFGVVANVRNKSITNGFKWTECTASKANEIGQVHSLWGFVQTKNAILINWKLNCVDEPIIVGYNISYCPLKEHSITECSEESKIEIVIPENDADELNRYEIVNLKSYTLYNISVSLMSHNRLGLRKTPIMIRTLESAPTDPRNLKAVRVEQTSIDLTWDRPLEVNGDAMTYQLWYNDHIININDNNTLNETFAFRLDNLKPFTRYIITVIACTSDCSMPSESLSLQTKVGVPERMYQPKLQTTSDNLIAISWELPKVIGGNLDYFELKLTTLKDDAVVKEDVYRLNRNSPHCVINNLQCHDERIDLSMRIVNLKNPPIENDIIREINPVGCLSISNNIDDNNNIEKFYGDWSQPIMHYCRLRYSSAMIAVIFILIILILIFIFLFIKFYQKYQKMKDIHIVLPKEFDHQITSSVINDNYESQRLTSLHVSSNVDENEIEKYDVNEKEKFISRTPSSPNLPDVTKREHIPLFIITPPPKTDAMNVYIPKMSQINKSLKSYPPTSVKANICDSNLPLDPQVDPNGYMKMNSPSKSPVTAVAGYLDMAGKVTNPFSKEPKKHSDYITNEVKSFIKDSDLNNNGYIAKRSSFLSDSNRKYPPIINSNGYVGFRK